MKRLLILVVFILNILSLPSSFADQGSGEMNNAISKLQKLIVEDNKKRSALIILINSLQKKGSFLLALEKTKSLELISSSIAEKVEVYNLKGNLLFNLKRFYEAEEAFEKSYKLNPSDITAHNIEESKVSKKDLKPRGYESCKKYNFTEENNFETRKPIVINFFGGVNTKNTGFLVKTIMSEIALGNCDFHINIDSSGGDPNDSFTAYNVLKQMPISISTLNANRVQSAAMHLYCLGEKRYANENSNFMIHAISWNVKSTTPLKFKKIQKQIAIQRKSLVEIYGACADIDKDSFNKFTDGNDSWYLDSDEAKKIDLTNHITSNNFVPKKVYLVTDDLKL